MPEWSELSQCLKKQLWISKNRMELESNETEFLVCADGKNYLCNRNREGRLQEVLDPCKTYGVEINAQKLSRPYFYMFPCGIEK
jgi:hypothetical protein